jgi:DNA-binding beta-propeller fold protein YncE
MSRFDSPYGVCISPNGEEIFVADAYNNRIRVLRVSDGQVIRSFGSKGSSPGQFNWPSGICISPNGGFLAVADTYNERVQVFHTTDGSHYRTLNKKFVYPSSVCYSPNGEFLFVADSDKNCIQMFSESDGKHVRTIKNEHLAELHDICISPDGEELYVVDSTRYIKVLNAKDGDYLRTIGGHNQFFSPQAICVTDSGFLFVSDVDKNNVQMIRATDGAQVQLINSRKSHSCGMCVSPNGDELYVTDLHKNSIRVFQI